MPIQRDNPALYRQLCQPHASADVAGRAIESFFEEVAAARVKYRIPEVHIIAQATCLVPERANGEGMAGLTMHLGDGREALTMVARDYARERKAIRDYLDILLMKTDGPMIDEVE